MIRELLKEANHCKDCCCARSWEALGITEYDGKSIVEHITELRNHAEELAVVLKKGEFFLAAHEAYWDRPSGFAIDNLFDRYKEFDDAIRAYREKEK